jgi:transposase
MESINDKYKNFDDVVADAKERTDDQILVGYIDLLAQYGRALIEENENLKQVVSDLKEIIARDASKKFGQSSERLKDVAGKVEEPSGNEGGDGRPEGGSSSAAEVPGEKPEELEARRKKQAALRAELKALDRKDAGMRARQAASAQHGGQDCRTVDSTVPEEERFCRECGAPLRRLRWREAHRLALKRMRLNRLTVRIERLYCPSCARKARIRRALKARGSAPAGDDAGSASGMNAAAVNGGQPGSGCTCADCAQTCSAGENGNGASAQTGREGSDRKDSAGASACTCADCAQACPAEGSGHGGEAGSGRAVHAGGRTQADGQEDASFRVTEADSMAVFPHCPATASTLAYFAAAKFEDVIPLARLEKMFKRLGDNAPRQTLSRWIVKMGGLPAPFAAFMHGWLVTSEIINADETPIRVYRVEGISNKSKKYLWIFYGHGGGGPKVFYCLYAPARSSSVPMDVLAGIEKVFLQTDGFSGCNAVKKLDGVTGVACLAHVRRKFHDVLDSVQDDRVPAEEELAKASAALDMLNGIAGVYAREKEIMERNLPPGEIVEARQSEVRPLLEELRRKMEETQKAAPRSCLLGKACTYGLGQWDGILSYMGHPDLTLDNNYLESFGIRPAAMGRKTFLFFQSEEGARAGAALLSIILTAKANGLNPEQYLMTLLKRIRKTPESRWEELLPWNSPKLEPFPDDEY